MSNSAKVELLTAVYSLLSTDAQLLNSGINPQTGASRTVAIYNQVTPNAVMPYVRITLTDAITLTDETFDYASPTVQTISLAVDTFSDYEKECFTIADRLEVLLNNVPFTSAHYQGYTWHRGSTFFADNQTTPDKVIRRGNMRMRANVEPL